MHGNWKQKTKWFLRIALFSPLIWMIIILLTTSLTLISKGLEYKPERVDCWDKYLYDTKKGYNDYTECQNEQNEIYNGYYKYK